jgi:hypothetical protein
VTIVDHVGNGRPPARGLASNGLGSFDLSKKSSAQLAAEFAAQMTSWRMARKKSDAPVRATAPAVGPAARPSIMLTTAIPPTDWGIATATRIDRARQVAALAGTLVVDRSGPHAARQAGSLGAPFKSLLAEGPNLDAVDMEPQDAPGPPPPAPMPVIDPNFGEAVPAPSPEIHTVGVLRAAARSSGGRAGRAAARVQQRGAAAWRALKPALRAILDRVRSLIRRIGPAVRRAARAAWPAAKSAGAQLKASVPALRVMARHAARDRLAIAGAAAVLVAIAAWFLAPPHGGSTPHEAARQQPETAHAQKVELQPAIEPHAIVAAFEATNRPKAAAIDRPTILSAAELPPHDPATLRLSQEPVLAFIPTLTPRLKPTVKTAQH